MAIIATIPQQQRQGVIDTPTFRLANLSGEVHVLGNIHPVDYENTAARLFADLYQEDPSVPGGWRLRATNRPDGWIGGRFVDPETGAVNPAPELFSLTVTEKERDTNFRAEFNVPVRIRAGLIVQTLER